MSDTKDLTHLGSETKYQFDKPDPALLETFENRHQGQLYLVPLTMPEVEFSSLCPKTGQPDWAKIEIVYVPRVRMVESKSLKLYLFSFRNHGEFHEDCVARIASDLNELLDPHYLRVYGDFNDRGGIAIKPLVERWNTSLPGKIDQIRWMVQTFDVKQRR